jgi:biotin carboxylase
MDRALEELVIQGVPTNRDEQLRIIRHREFRSGAFGTGFYERFAREDPAGK